MNLGLIMNIGNIVLLDKGVNSDIGNKSFADKKRIINEKSQLISTKEVFELVEKWKEEEIYADRG